MRRLSVWIAILVCYTGLFLIFISWTHYSAYRGPVAKEGSLDLTHWNFENDGTVLLNGAWRLYPHQLLTPRMIRSGKETDQVFTIVPTPSVALPITTNEFLNKGTYRLSIRSNQNQLLGIQTAGIYSANKIFLNGQLIGQSGIPSAATEKHTSLRPYTAYFPIHKGMNELVVQFSRATGSSSWGIAKPITLGTEQQITRQHDTVLFNDQFMIVAFLIMGLYFLGYYFQRRKDRHVLIFSVLCLSLSLLISWSSSGKTIYLLFPSLSLNALIVIESLSSLVPGICVFLFLRNRYQPFVSKKIIYSGIILSVLTFLLDLLDMNRSNMDILTPATIILHTFLSLLVVGYASFIFMLAIVNKTESSLYLSIAVAAMGVFVLFASISTYSALQLYPLFTVSSLLFLLAIALMLSQQFANAFKHNEVLSQELLQADHMKDQFISRTSHEFRTPLNGMINIVQNMLNGPSSQTINEERDKLQLLTRIGYRLSNLINDILDLEKMKHGLLQIKKTPLDIHALIEMELPFFKMLAEQKHLALRNDVPESLPLVWADEVRVRQIINNLMDNAIKYTQKGEVAIRARRNGQKIDVSIQDSGIGIPPSELENIFNPYKRGHWNQSEGVGLGLAIVQQLAELQGGDLRVLSEVGAGSTFIFTLPLADATSIPSIQPTQNMVTEHAPISTLVTPYFSRHVNAPFILIADDDLDNLNILIHTLEAIPYNVIAVKNGDEALQMISEHALDLVILDLMMPGKSGFEVCEAVRKNHGPSELPILMLTAAIVNEEKHLALRAGANDILQKPYNFSELSARIRGLIMMKEAAQQATNMEVAFLQSQIKPHFLYNVLNSIIALSYEDIEQAREMTGQFATYLRSSFDFQNTHSLISFRKEFSLVQAYLAIEQFRFGDRIQVHYAIEENLDFQMPPLLIQPLIENAVQHGIGKKKKGGLITLTARHTDKGYWISVSDNGVGMKPEQVQTILTEKNSRSVGLNNVHSRLKHFYGTELQISSTFGKGTTFSMLLPD